MIASRSFGAIFVAVVAVSIAACGKKQEAGQPPPAAASVSQKPKIVPPVQKQVSTAVQAVPQRTDFASKKDPFKPFVVAPKVPVAAKTGSSVLPILAYDVTQFRLIGIIAGLKESRAMAVDPAGKAYVLKEGMHLGKNDGRITRITNSYVEVTEQYREDSGKLKTHVVRITLPRKS
jgi:type IV pilus assembly protein PilP